MEPSKATGGLNGLVRRMQTSQVHNTMNAAIQVLNDEHKVILSAIQELQTVLTDGIEKHPVEEIENFLTFFGEYGDLFHHQKEEAILFGLLEKEFPDLGGSIIASLKEHHTHFRDLISNAKKYLAKRDFAALSMVLSNYISDLQDHISAEDDEFFVSVQDLLGERAWDRLFYQFKDRDRELGNERKEKWEARFNVLKSVRDSASPR